MCSGHLGDKMGGAGEVASVGAEPVGFLPGPQGSSCLAWPQGTALPVAPGAPGASPQISTLLGVLGGVPWNLGLLTGAWSGDNTWEG